MSHYSSAYESDEEKARAERKLARQQKMNEAIKFVKDKFGLSDQAAKEYIGLVLINKKILEMLE